jgi:hypothetical protein
MKVLFALGTPPKPFVSAVSRPNQMSGHLALPFGRCSPTLPRPTVCRSPIENLFSIDDRLSGDMSGTDVYYYLEHGKRLERPTRCPSSTYRLMSDCWQWDEKKRPTFSQLVQLLRTDADPLETNKSASNSTLPRSKALKPTSSSSTLTDENTPNGDFDDEDDGGGDDDRQSVSSKEQYRGNGHGHSLRSHRSFARDRTKS